MKRVFFACNIQFNKNSINKVTKEMKLQGKDVPRQIKEQKLNQKMILKIFNLDVVKILKSIKNGVPKQRLT